VSGLEAFYSQERVAAATWQGLERLVHRLLILKGFEHVWLVGQSGDGGADVIATRRSASGGDDIRWLVQAKKLNRPVGDSVVDETLSALMRYGAKVPLIVSSKGFASTVFRRQEQLVRDGINLQLWDAPTIERLGRELSTVPLALRGNGLLQLRNYQATAIERIVDRFTDQTSTNALVVLATGLGKTLTAAEAIRRIRSGTLNSKRVLVLAHTIDLVHQLERSFWPFMSPEDATCIVSGDDRPSSFDELAKYAFVFATRDSVHQAQQRDLFPNEIFDLVVVDECHHLGASTYESVLECLRAGQPGGPFLIGLTATPWRPNGGGLEQRFDEPVIEVDLPTGLRDGYLANVDYRIFTDNVDWQKLREIEGDRFTPEKINRTLFITNWTDGIIERTQEAWHELGSSCRAIIFCGTINHANTVARKINGLGFATAATLASKGSDGKPIKPFERSRKLWDFASGRIGVLCAVDVLNEGIDVPDVNLVIFQRVTHSRRIFIQQLGRGLRLSDGKDKVLVLDFVTDIRRFAEGLSLGIALDDDGPRPGDIRTVTLPSKVRFMRATEEDFDSKRFLSQWLKDIEVVAEAGEDVSVLSYPNLDLLPNHRVQQLGK
jgi:superfamily II DNA or RNA helicase